MRVLVWSTGVDTGGQGHRIGQGFAAHAPDWHVDVLANAPSALGYPEEYKPPGHRRILARTLYGQADVVHLRTNLDGWRQLDAGQGKPIILHHHGSMFRDLHGGIARGARSIGAVQIASTLDLTLLEPGVEWLPSPYNLAELALMRQQHRVGGEFGVGNDLSPEQGNDLSPEQDVDLPLSKVGEGVTNLAGVPGEQFVPYVGRDVPGAHARAVSGPVDSVQFKSSVDGPRHGADTIRIAHFPTSAGVKSTHAFLAATQRLAERYPVEILTNVTNGRVRHIPWRDVLAQKAQADIYFDQVQLGYGNNAIEAWGMGIPVVAGAADPNVRALMVERFGRLPFVEATEDTLYESLERLVLSKAMRDEYGQLGMAHVQRFHDDAVVVAQLQGIYSGAPHTTPLILPRPSPRWLANHPKARAAA